MKDENEDISIDPAPEQARYGAGDEYLDDSVVAEEAQGETIKKLRDKLKVSEEKAKGYLDSWQRAQADFANLRKRDEEAKVEFIKFANAGFVEQLLPVIDSFEMALSHGDKSVEVIYNQLMQVLKSNGLDEISAVGETFNPQYHESIGVAETDKKEDEGKVLEVLQKGYILSNKIIRPAKVKIGQYNG